MKIAKSGDCFMFQCPACGCCHGPNSKWEFNGDFDKPTFSPSIKVTGKRPITDAEILRINNGEKINLPNQICHSYVKDGKIQFLADCTHAMAGQTVELPEW
jgi:hypothetical protein